MEGVNNDFQRAIDAIRREDYRSAFDLLLPLAEGGHPEAQSMIGNIYEVSLHRANMDEVQEFYDHDKAEAAKWYALASSLGFGPATHNLAGMYASGYGNLSPDEAKNKAEYLYELARQQGCPVFDWFTASLFPEAESPRQEYWKMVEDAKK